MSTELIQTKDYLLFIDEEDEIKDKDYFYTEEKSWKIDKCVLNNLGILGEKQLSSSPISRDLCKKIIAYYPLTKEAKELDLPLLPNPFKDNFDLKQEIIRWYHSKSGTTLINDPSLNEIIDKAQSKQFSLEDIKKAMEYGMYKMKYHTIEAHEEFIQSLSTQQLPKEFIPEYVTKCYCGHTNICDCGRIEDKEFIQKIKTITNLEGKEKLVGVYKY